MDRCLRFIVCLLLLGILIVEILILQRLSSTLKETKKIRTEIKLLIK